MPKKEPTPTLSGHEKEVDVLFSLEEQISQLASKAKVKTDSLKEIGKAAIKAFGSINILGSGQTHCQIQKKRPSCYLEGETAVLAVKELLGEDLFGLLFDVKTTYSDEEALRKDRIDDLKKLIVKSGEDVSDFFCVAKKSVNAEASDNFFIEEKREALINKFVPAKKREGLFDRVVSFCSMRGSLSGILAHKWGVTKE